jgi:hypothetical protein
MADVKRWLFLRGAVPSDRDPQEIKHMFLEDEDDMWIHLFAGLVGPYDVGTVVYYGADDCWKRNYRENLEVCACVRLENVQVDNWDFILARGGFKVQDDFCARSPGFKIYYGAGKRFIPSGEVKWDLVLVDSFGQLDDVRKVGYKAELLLKPAAPLFKPKAVEKQFDLCYVPNQPNNPNKGCSWVYRTAPSDCTILQLGYPVKNMVTPKNVTSIRVPRWEVPEWMSKCRVGLVPYGKEDSGPRVIPEMMACGLPVVCCNEVNFSPLLTPQYVCDRENFWHMAAIALDNVEPEVIATLEKYSNQATVPLAVEHLRKNILKHLSK